MARDFGRWFRFYDGVLDDPKVQRLPDKLFRAWVNLMCLASRSGGRIEADYAAIGFSLRISEGQARDTLQALASAGLMDIEETGIEPHNWGQRQFKTDADDPTGATRQKRWRDRNKERDSNGTVTDDRNGDERYDSVTVKRPDTETETYTEQKQSRTEQSARERATAKGSRWPSEAVVSEDWIEEGRQARLKHGLPAVDLKLVAEQFGNYWTAESGRHAVKLDWRRTWLKWATSQKVQSNGFAANGQPGHRLGDFGPILEREHTEGPNREPDGPSRSSVRKAQGPLAGDDRADGRGVVQSLALLPDRGH